MSYLTLTSSSLLFPHISHPIVKKVVYSLQLPHFEHLEHFISIFYLTNVNYSTDCKKATDWGRRRRGGSAKLAAIGLIKQQKAYELHKFYFIG